MLPSLRSGKVQCDLSLDNQVLTAFFAAQPSEDLAALRQHKGKAPCLQQTLVPLDAGATARAPASSCTAW